MEEIYDQNKYLKNASAFYTARLCLLIAPGNDTWDVLASDHAFMPCQDVMTGVCFLLTCSI